MAFCAVTETLESIFLNMPRWKGRRVGVEGYPAHLVNADEVQALMPKRAEGTDLTSGEAWRPIPGMKNLSMPKFIEAGCLDVIHEQYPVTRRTVLMPTRESVERFKDTYVSLSDLCQNTGRHHAEIMPAKGGRDSAGVLQGGV